MNSDSLTYQEQQEIPFLENAHEPKIIEWLKENQSQEKTSVLNSRHYPTNFNGLREQFEPLWLEKNDVQINLTLAKFGQTKHVLQKLISSKFPKMVRAAALANPLVGQMCSVRERHSLISDKEIYDLYKKEKGLFHVLFENNALDAGFVSKIFARGKVVNWFDIEGSSSELSKFKDTDLWYIFYSLAGDRTRVDFFRVERDGDHGSRDNYLKNIVISTLETLYGKKLGEIFDPACVPLEWISEIFYTNGLEISLKPDMGLLKTLMPKEPGSNDMRPTYYDRIETLVRLQPFVVTAMANYPASDVDKPNIVEEFLFELRDSERWEMQTLFYSQAAPELIFPEAFVRVEGAHYGWSPLEEITEIELQNYLSEDEVEELWQTELSSGRRSKEMFLTIRKIAERVDNLRADRFHLCLFDNDCFYRDRMTRKFLSTLSNFRSWIDGDGDIRRFQRRKSKLKTLRPSWFRDDEYLDFVDDKDLAISSNKSIKLLEPNIQKIPFIEENSKKNTAALEKMQNKILNMSTSMDSLQIEIQTLRDTLVTIDSRTRDSDDRLANIEKSAGATSLLLSRIPFLSWFIKK